MAVLIGGALIVLATACSGGSGGGAAAAPVASDPPAPTVRYATTQQIASIVAKRKADLQAQAARLDSTPNCDAGVAIDCLLFSAQLATVAETLGVELQGAAEDRPENRLYVGAYPAGLAPLVTQTLAAISVVKDAQVSYRERCTDKTTGECLSSFGQLDRAVQRLSQQLDAWKPYGA